MVSIRYETLLNLYQQAERYQEVQQFALRHLQDLFVTPDELPGRDEPRINWAEADRTAARKDAERILKIGDFAPKPEPKT